ncbi:alpha/beta fold hydrolase [Noviherbaspirillum saxi]|uniref:Alpha/beta fold hydrolase n=2 Tax=Noviherbaspirillum saxi TaxID=2320863 RepID=A0A3A3FME5_9BURK|nr:alpha/beta fold hydrolase [Noviherbaspirillum saxi]
MAPERLASGWLGIPASPHPRHEDAGKNLDRVLQAGIGRFTGGISPAAIWMAYVDWIIHLHLSPAKQEELLLDAWNKLGRWNEYGWDLARHAGQAHDTGVRPLPQDKRFIDPTWQQWPFNVAYQGFLMTQQWWHRATTDISGVSRHHEDVVTFGARQLLDMLSPSNFPITNPVVLHETIRSGGLNFWRGAVNAINDWKEEITGKPSEQPYKVGETLAVTPGNVVFRNRLIELIQYTPTTPTVHAVPVLFIPAWIMKYYILDLSPHNSLVRYLVGKGYTVFMISWKNPHANDRDFSMNDYRELGVMAAVNAICSITGAPRVSAVGYCLGGTLLSIAAATMARDGDQRLANMTLFASQVDFKEPGELSLFIDESQVALLESIMWEKGYLDSKQMAGAFHILRSNDLIWSRRLNQYLLGRTETVNDLMAWNTDTTRMPYRMHTEYLRDLFLENKLAEGRYEVSGQPIALTDIRVPIFSVGTLTDHVAPWRSAYKIHLLTDTDVTFLLTSGGHNAGVVSPPGHPNRRYQVGTSAHHAPYIDPEIWHANTPSNEDSWWPEWENWMAARSGDLVMPPRMGKALCDAPGTYVLQS